MTIDPNTPVIIGAAQRTWRRGSQPGPEPLDAWEIACREAVTDAGLGPCTAAQAGGLWLADCMSWRYDDPHARLGRRLGAAPRLGRVGAPSGTSGQTLFDEAAAEIRGGHIGLALVCGGEMLATARYYRGLRQMPPWHHPHSGGPQHAFDLDAHQHPGEVAIGLTEGIGAVYGFAMRDIARRAHLGIAPQAYRDHLAETLAGLTRVAASNPDAWFAEARTANELSTPHPDNRFVAYPYTKRMVAMIEVDISAALLIASQAWADSHGVPAERRIYPWVSCYAEDPVYIAVRPELWRSPAMEAACRATLDAARLSIDEIEHIDLYSCFPSAINFARDALGISECSGERLTLTGGLPYAGGPASSYMLTSIVAAVRRLRLDRRAKALISGLGMMMSNHVFALYAAAPPGREIGQPDGAAVQARLDTLLRLDIRDDYTGPATVAAYTVMYGRDGQPSHGAAICDVPGPARCHARILDSRLLDDANRNEWVGRAVDIAAGKDVGTIVRLL